MDTNRIIIFGAGGMLGTDLAKTFKYYNVYAFSKIQADITNKKIVFEKINKINPRIVVNSAAYTDVDGCEKNKNQAFNVNGKAVKIIAEACKKNNIPLLHISTDYVFDGKKNGYKENDKTNPVNIYGKSKALGEKHLAETLDKYYLIRTSWLFGKRGKNFVGTILRLAKEKKELKVVNDQFGRPTYAKDLANKIKEIVEAKMPFGTYHITNSGTCTWFQFAKKIIEFRKLNARLKPIMSEELNRPAKRPKCSVLLNTKLLPLRHWHPALKDYLGV